MNVDVDRSHGGSFLHSSAETYHLWTARNAGTCMFDKQWRRLDETGWSAWRAVGLIRLNLQNEPARFAVQRRLKELS